ncbi:radial spoke head protein 3 homolog B-like isoform X4 [Diabrotica virgifera virgifera]|uniref:Uncharacterized protein n=1 Tax=Diabrotica virgifera virgifera TaxID=50390 RepID=A0ABM5L687_DIAVI|nr:radial spoke head protein 3 homolog B-like isoform X4 [Diabrotica virgifera virgifera]
MTSATKMAPTPSETSGDEDQLAFKVINQDNFPIVVVGQPILKPFDQSAQKNKPNLIVHPIRRISKTVEDAKPKLTEKPSGLLNSSNENTVKVRKNLSSSHGNLCHNNSTVQMKLEDLENNLELENFNKILDSKLKRLQKNENKQQQKSSYSDPPTSRKPFVTTVKKGQFLEPPPEIALLMGVKIEEPKVVRKNPKELKKLYAFASQPRLLSRTPPRTVHQSRDASKPRSTIEKKVHREHYVSTLENQADRNISNTRAEQAKRRALARKRAINQQVKPAKPTIVRYAVPHHLQEKMLDISQLQHLLRTKELTDAATQTENDQCLTQESISIEKAHAQVQVHPTDLFDFNIEVQPIVEVLVSKTIEEALIEVLEEEELMAMKEQQRKFLEYMATNTSDELESDLNENTFKKFSENIFRNNYMPNLITSV